MSRILSPRQLLLIIGAALIFLQLRFHSMVIDGIVAHSLAYKPAEGRWMWNSTRDRNNHSLTDCQCMEAFPDLYFEIDRAVSYWSTNTQAKRITPASISLHWSGEDGLQGMIYDQQVYVTHVQGLNHFPHWFQRHRATLFNIQRAVATAPEPVPNIEFAIKIDDVVGLDDQHPNTTFWAFLRDISNSVQDQLWMIPDSNFWAYPEVTGSFQHFQGRVLELNEEFQSKIPMVVWRGTTAYNAEVRNALMQQASNQPWSAVASIEGNPANQISIEEHCKYQFAVHTEGTTWSGRLKYLLSCNSVVFIHPLRYMTHLYHLLQAEGEGQNYVAVARDFRDLPAKVWSLIQRSDEAERIAANAAATFRDRYVTPAAQTCYFRKLFGAWRKVSFEPEPYEDVQDVNGNAQRVWRGMTLEEYLFTDATFTLT